MIGTQRTRSAWVAAGICGVLAPLVFLATTFAAGAATPGYDAFGQAISELFARGAAAAPVVKAGLVAFAALALPFAVVLRRAPRGGLPVAAVAVLVDALATGLLVLVPCSPGCPGPGASTVDLLHLVVAGIAYGGHLSAPLLAWWKLRKQVSSGPALARASAVLGALGIAGFLVWASGAAGAAGGLWQRAFTIAGDLWFVVVGVAVVRESTTRDRPWTKGNDRETEKT